MIETRHLDTSNYTTVIGEVHLLNLINEVIRSWLLLFLSISFIFHIGIHGRKNKNCVTKTLLTNFTRRNCFPQYGRICSLFLIRSHAKYLHFCELNMKTRKCLRVVSLSTSSLVVVVVLCLYCNLNVLYLHDSTQCYKHSNARPTVVRSPLSLYLKSLFVSVRTPLLKPQLRAWGGEGRLFSHPSHFGPIWLCFAGWASLGPCNLSISRFPHISEARERPVRFVHARLREKSSNENALLCMLELVDVF